MTALARLWNELFPSRAQRERDSVLESLHRKLKAAQARVREAYDYADGLVSDWELERELLRREPGYRGDRRHGDNWPYLRSMEDLRHYRGLSRQACEGNAYGLGFLDRAVDFVIGDGMQPVVTLRGAAKGAVPTGVVDRDGDGQPDADPSVQSVQGVLDDFRELNDWGCGTEDREEEGFRRSQRDGEVFVRFFRGGSDTGGLPRVRWVEPEQVDSPPSALPHERWGIRTAPDDVETREAFYVYDLADTGGEWVESSAMVWHKLGTDRTVLRGMPQFWLVASALSQCEKLNSAVAEVSAIQAQIAYVREHAPGILPGQITEFVGAQGDTTARKATPHGDRYRRVGYGENGTVVDMSAGTKFNAGPVSQGVPGFVSALQSRLRQVCARFGYPEFFSGDASNGNYASLLAAGGPAEKAFRRRQQRYASFQAAVYRRACEYAVESGRLREEELSSVEVRVKPGKVSVSNQLEEAQVDQILIQNKVKSVQTAMLERGLDPRVETANLQAWADKFEGKKGDESGQGSDPFGGLGLGESYSEDEYEQLLHEYRAGLVLKVVGTHPRTGKPIRRWVRMATANTHSTPPHAATAPPAPGDPHNLAAKKAALLAAVGGGSTPPLPPPPPPTPSAPPSPPPSPPVSPPPSPPPPAGGSDDVPSGKSPWHALAQTWVDQSTGLSEKQQKRYIEQMIFTLERLPPASRAIALAAIKKVSFHPTMKSLRAEYKRLSGKSGKRVIGFTRPAGPDKVELYLDGPDGKEPESATYAHEFGHAVDTDGQFSGTPEWERVYNRDIKKNAGKNILSKYALENSCEGFAEVYRRLVSHGEKDIEAKWPLVHAFLKSKGLL